MRYISSQYHNTLTMRKHFAILVSVFFFWGFVAASNDILIPVFQSKLSLEQWQSQMISFIFYVAYTVGALGYLLLTRLWGKDLVATVGYGKSLGIGLWISALGTLLFIPAANQASFPLLLAGLLVVGLGFSLQQTVANPLAIALGTPETGSQRLSMAGGVNNLGTTLGPLVVSIAIFGIGANASTTLDIEAVKLPYLALGALFTLFGFIFWKSDFGGPAAEEADAVQVEAPSGTLGLTQVWMGMIAIFVYVGVEVSTASNLPAYLEKFQGVALHEIAPYVSLYWASLMIGRWTAASGAMGLSGTARQAMRWVMPLAAFGVFLAVNTAAGHNAVAFLPYLAAIALLTLLDWSTKGNPARQLLYYSVAGAAALILGMNAEGPLAIYAFLSVGLFASTLWPCIFTLAITGLGGRTPQASNALIMMIMGGGIVSLLQGYLADDALLGLRQSFWVGVVCFAYLAFYAVTVSRVLKSRGVDLDQLASEGGH